MASSEFIPPTGLLIRVITPQLARRVDHSQIPLLNNGLPIALSTTLRQLKAMIATHLGVEIHTPATDALAPECNCNLARSIAKYGIWDMLLSRGGRNLSEKYKYELNSSSGGCRLCGRALNELCNTCLNNENSDPSYCPQVVNAGCEHVFHHHCYVQHHNVENGIQLCPGGCSQGQLQYAKRANSQRQLTER